MLMKTWKRIDNAGGRAWKTCRSVYQFRLSL
jgi:hypothetical protein